jgi:hypothetical protein
LGEWLGFADGLGNGSEEGLEDTALFGEELGCADGFVDRIAEGIDDWALVGEELGFADGVESREGLDDVALDGCGRCADGMGVDSAEGLDDVATSSATAVGVSFGGVG